MLTSGRVFWLAVAVMVMVSGGFWLTNEAQPQTKPLAKRQDGGVLIAGRYDSPVPVPTRVVKTVPTTASKAKTDAAPAEEATATGYSVKAGSSVKEGEVLIVDIKDPAGLTKGGKAYLAGRGATIYSKGGDDYFALVSVDIYQKPGGYKLAIQDYNGQTVYKQPVEIIDPHYPRQNIQVSSSTAGLQPLPGELETIGALKTMETPTRYWESPFISPTPDCQNSPFGVKRYHNGVSTGDYHKGLDLRSPMGRPIKATNAGKVVIAKNYRLHGGTVGLDHGQGVTSIYIHMSKIAVSEGDFVKKGDVIGYVGSTGFATGPHLHWGLYIDGLPVNPNQFVYSVPKC